MLAAGWVRYQRSSLVAAVPKGLSYFAKFVVYLADPVDRFCWAWKHLKVDARLGVDMATFLQQPKQHMVRLGAREQQLLHNGLAFDLGAELPHDATPAHPTATSLLQEVVHLPKMLVLLPHRLDESLVMLRRVLCWSQADILYDAGQSDPPAPAVAADLADRIRDFNSVDVAIWKAASSEFDHHIDRIIGFEAEVRRFVAARQAFAQACASLNAPATNVSAPTVLFADTHAAACARARAPLPELLRAICAHWLPVV